MATASTKARKANRLASRAVGAFKTAHAQLDTANTLLSVARTAHLADAELADAKASEHRAHALAAKLTQDDNARVQAKLAELFT